MVSFSQKRIFLISIAMAAAATGIFFSVLSNYLYEIYQIDAEGRGFLEFFREMPGVLTVVFLAAIVVMRERSIMIIAALIIAASVVGLAYMPSQYWVAVIFIFMWSVGAHINLVLHQSYGVALSSTRERGKLFGAIGGMRGVGYVLGTGVVWIGMGYLGLGFAGAFVAAGIFSIIAAIGYCFLKPRAHTARRRRRLVLKRKYSLFYLLAVLFSLRSAHTTYLSKIAHNHDELTSTISVSFAIEHVVSMTGPILAGIVWVKFGFSWVFAMAGAVAIMMFFAALRIPPHGELLMRGTHAEEGEIIKDEL